MPGRIAITGMGAVCALGTCIREITAGLYEENPRPRLRPPHELAHGGVEPLPLPFFAVPDAAWAGSPRNGRGRDTLHLGMLATAEAMACAELDGGGHGMDAAVVAGTTSGTALHFLSGYADYRRGGTGGGECETYLVSNPSLFIGSALKLHGPRLTLSNACVSGTDAIGVAAGMIAAGRCRRALCGGLDALSIVPHTGFARLMIYDAAPCRPFDAGRAGLNLGEGAAFLVLEDEETAGARGVRILGFVDGYGSASDAHHFTAPHPQGAGLERALAEAGVLGSNPAFINVHGTGTRENDKVEGAALHRLFPETPLWATKGLTGHALGAAGALEAVFTLIALRRGIVPASAGHTVPDPETGACPTTSPVRITSGHALSTSLGFGGCNSVLAISTEQA